MNISNVVRHASVAMLIGGLAAASLSAQSGNELFQQGLVSERSDGKLQDAIAIYQRIVKDFAGDRPLVAKTLVQLGRAQERLGATEARKAYERVLKDYADQPTAAAEARRRIAALDGSDSRAVSASRDVPATRLVYPGDGTYTSSAVTPDGRYLVYTREAALAVRELAGGSVRYLTDTSRTPPGVAQVPIVSPDGRTIVYRWVDAKTGAMELRAIPLRGGEPRTLLAGADFRFYRGFDFTADNSKILVGMVPMAGRGTRMGFLPTQGGTLTELASLADETTRARISPDGKYIVYEATQDSTGRRDILMMRIDGSNRHALVGGTADDRLPVWTPDGRGLVFVSDRDGANGSWFVAVSNEQTSGSPTKVLSSPGVPVWFTRAGTLYYGVNNQRSDYLESQLDINTGKWITPAAPLRTAAGGLKHDARWSMDGKQVAYVTNNYRTLRIYDVAASTEREISLAAWLYRPAWSPDGKKLAMVSMIDSHRASIHLVDATSGALQRVTTTYTQQWGNSLAFSRDGTSLFYFDSDSSAPPKTARTRVVRRDLNTGAERVLHTSVPGTLMVNAMALSPDGKSLAFGEEGNLYVVSTDGTTPARAVAKEFDARKGVSWTSDGSALVHAAPDHRRLAIVPLDGSVPRFIDAPRPSTWGIALGPDGRHALIQVVEAGSELWAADHILPKGR